MKENYQFTFQYMIDQRLMENGHWNEANQEKLRLEEKQRAKRRKREAEAVESGKCVNNET